MSLLPFSAKVKDQQFAELYDIQSRVDYSDIAPDPLTCHISLLPHIALQKGANIENMKEAEARNYLKTFTKKTIGTAGAVEDAINVCFDNAELIEWFDDENLKKGMFNVSVYLKDDVSLVYDERLFSLSRRLINESKNVRSKLDAFDLKVGAAGELDFLKAVSTNVVLTNDFDFVTMDKNINLSANGISDVSLSSSLTFEAAAVDFSFSGANVLDVELENSVGDYISICEIKNINGGVVDVKLQNNPNYESEADMNLKIRGGVVWAF